MLPKNTPQVNYLQHYFLYTRKSTDVEDKQVMSIEAQVTELRALAIKEGLSVVEEFVEKQSAKAPGRPVFNEMLSRVEKGEAQGIICWKLDRLARNPVDGGQISWFLQRGIIQHVLRGVHLGNLEGPKERQADDRQNQAGFNKGLPRP